MNRLVGRALAPVAALGTRRRAELCERLGVAVKKCIVLVAYGGFDCDLQAARWPQTPGLCWLIPQAWGLQRADMRSIESCGLPFTDLLASVDAEVYRAKRDGKNRIYVGASIPAGQEDSPPDDRGLRKEEA